MTLKRSKDRKVANSATKSGNVVIANAFGLPSGSNYSCPGATSVCESICYAGKIEKQYVGVRNLLTHNFDQLRDASLSEMTILLLEMVSEFRAECEKRGAEKLFRIHWDGDYFSRRYAMAWAIVMDRNSDVQFWSYTRSFTPDCNVVPILANIRNHSLYLSVDNANRHFVNDVLWLYPTVKLASLADTFANAKLMIKEWTITSTPNCPELTKAIPLITENGGACKTCGLCVEGRNNISFATTRK